MKKIIFLFVVAWLCIANAPNLLAQTAEAGPDATICANQYVLQANQVTPPNYGAWMAVSGSGIFSEMNVYNTMVYAIGLGSNTFRWMIFNSNDVLVSSDDVVITNNSITSNAGIDQVVQQNTATLSADNPAPGIGMWSMLGGTATITNVYSYNTTVTNLAEGANTFRTASDDVIIYYNATPPESANAGNDSAVCENNFILQANQPVAPNHGVWSVIGGSGSFGDANQYNTMVYNLSAGANTLRWSIYNQNNTLLSSDDVIITNNSITSNAGIDQTVQQNTATLSADNPAPGIGMWSMLGGTATITNVYSYNTTVTNLAEGANTFRWTVTNNGCTASDDVTITYTPQTNNDVVTITFDNRIATTELNGCGYEWIEKWVNIKMIANPTGDCNYTVSNGEVWLIGNIMKLTTDQLPGIIRYVDIDVTSNNTAIEATLYAMGEALSVINSPNGVSTLTYNNLNYLVIDSIKITSLEGGVYEARFTLQDAPPSIFPEFRFVQSSPNPMTYEFYNESYSLGLQNISYQWDFDGDEITDSEELNPTFTYTTAGTYQAKLTVTSGNIVQSVNHLVEIAAPPSCNTTLPYTTSFETDAEWQNWTVSNFNNDQYQWQKYDGANIANTGSYFAAFNWSNTEANDFLFSPCVTLEAGKTYNFKFWYKHYAAGATDFVIGYSQTTVPYNEICQEQISDIGIFYNQKMWEITPESSGIYYFYIMTFGTTNSNKLFIDDVTIEEKPAPPCNLSGYIYPAPLTCNDYLLTAYKFDTQQNTKYFWNFGDGATHVSAFDTVSHHFATAGDYTVNLRMQDSVNTECFFDTLVTVSVKAINTDFTYTVNQNRVHFIGTVSGTNNFNSNWNFGDGNSNYGSLNLEHLYAQAETYNVSFVASDASNYQCTDTATQTVTITQIGSCELQASFMNESTGGGDCNNKYLNIYITPYEYANPTQTNWDFGDNTTALDTTNWLYHYYSNGVYQVEVTVVDSVNPTCVAKAYKTVVVDAPSVTVTHEIQDKQVQFHATIDGNYSNINWNYSDFGYDYNTTDPVHTFFDYGKQWASLSVGTVGESMCTVNKTDTVELMPLCNISGEIIANQTSCLEYSFVANANNNDRPYEVEWNFGDNTEPAFGDDAYHSFEPGNYLVSMILRDTEFPSCSTTVQKIIKARNLLAMMDTIVAQNRVQFQSYVNRNEDDVFVNWLVNGQTFENTPSLVYVFPEATSYEVSMQVQDKNAEACSVTETKYIDINSIGNCNLTVTFNEPVQVNCDSYKFSANILNGNNSTNVVWDFGDGTLPQIGNPVIHTYTTNDEFQITVIVTDQQSPDSCRYVYKRKAHIKTLNVNFNYNIMRNMVHLNGYIMGKESGFVWMLNNQPLENTDLNTFVSIDTTIVNTIKLKAYVIYNNQAVCVDSSTVVIPTGNQPHVVAQIIPGFVYAEVGQSIDFQDASLAFNTTIESRVWGIDNNPNPEGYGTSFTYTFNTPGLHFVKLIVSAGQQTSTQMLPIYIRQHSCIEAVAWFKPWQACRNFKFEAFVHGSDALYNALWNFGDGNFTNEMTTEHTFSQAGDFIANFTISEIDNQMCQVSKEFMIPIPEVPNNFRMLIDENKIYTRAMLPPNGEFNVTWSFDYQPESYDTFAIHKFVTTGDHMVCLGVYDYQTGCSDTNCKTVTIETLDDCDMFTYFIPRREENSTVSLTNLSSPDLTYLWDFGDGSTSTEYAPMPHPYEASGAYNICLTVWNETNNCQEQYCDVIFVGEVTCYATFDFTAGADPLTIIFTNNSIGGNEYYWYFGDGESSNEQNPVHLFAQAGVYWITLSIYNAETNCWDYKDRQIIVGEITCYADFNYYIEYETSTVYFSNNSSGTINKWRWNFDDGTFSDELSPLHTFAAGFYNIKLQVFDSVSQCMSTVVKMIEIGTTACNAEFSFFVDNQTGTVNFTNESTTDNTSYTMYNWYYDDGAYDTIQNPSHTFASNGVHYVCLYLYSDANGGCWDGECKEILVQGAQEVVCNAQFDYFINPNTNEGTFINRTTGPNEYQGWTFSDGGWAEGDTITHQFEGNCMYSVCLYTYDNATGCYSEQCQNIQIGQLLCHSDFDFIVNPLNNTVNVHAQPMGSITSYYWDFGDGFTSTNANESHQYQDAGYYTVTLAVSNGNGCYDTKEKYIQVGETSCLARFIYTVDPETDSVFCFNQSIGNVSNFYWYFDDGTYSNEENPRYKFWSPGLHYAWLTVSNISGTCWDSYYQTVQVGTVNCSAMFTTFIDPTTNTVNFINDGVGELTQQFWSFGDGNYSTDINPQHQYPVAGYYTVELATYSQATNCMDYYSQDIMISGQGNDCNPDFSYMVDGSNVSFADQSSGSVSTYFWDFGDGVTSIEQNPTHVYTENGYHNVCLTVINTSGIGNTSCKYVETGESCLAKFTYTINGNNVIFSDMSVGTSNATRTWDFGDGTQGTGWQPTHTYAEPNFYLVHLNVVTATCSSDYYDVVNVQGGNHIVADFGYNITGGTKSGTGVKFQGGTSGGGTRHSWDFGDRKGFEVVNTPTPTHVYTASGTYTVRYAVTDPLTNEGDTATHQITVTVVGVDNEIVSNNTSLAAYPNPFSTETTIEYSISKNSKIEITVFDALGNCVSTIYKGEQTAGTHTLPWSKTDTKEGVYYLKLKTDNETITKKLVIVK